jgi:ABC-type hemin transport system substrate-binding protein
MLGAGCALVAAAALVGCEVEPAPDAERGADEPSALRIVSLSPAITRTLADFKLADRVVGRTPWCAGVEASVPVVGDLVNLDYELLVRLHPTHVLIQPPSAGVPSELRRVAERDGWRVVDWRLSSIGDISHMASNLPDQLFERGTTGHAAAAERSREILAAIAESMKSEPPRSWSGATLMVESVDPVLAFGSETYLHALLSAMGGTNATTARGWVQLSMEDVVKLNPGALIIVDPRGSGTVADPVQLGALGEVKVEAIQHGRVAVLTHRDALLPSTAVIEVARELREILDRFAESAP